MLPHRIRGPKAKRENAPPKVQRRSPAHCDFVRDHACVVCGSFDKIEVAHVRDGTDCGMGMKPADRWTISLCRPHHSEQHRIGEGPFEQLHGIDMKALAAEFVKASPKRVLLEQMP